MYEIIINLDFTHWINEYTDHLDSFSYEVKVRLIAENKEVAEKEVERLQNLSASQLKSELAYKHDALIDDDDDLERVYIYCQELTVNFTN